MAIAMVPKTIGSNPLQVRILHPPPKHMFNFWKQKKQAVGTKELTKQLKSLEDRLEKTTKELAALQEAHKNSLTKVGVVRFNPFGEIGGDQSFSVALLDSRDSGVVITSHYGKEMQRIYAKPLKQGKSEYSLSAEEEEAIRKARNS